jgi:hypothetical protein
VQIRDRPGNMGYRGFSSFKCCSTLSLNIGNLSSQMAKLAVASSAILLVYCATVEVCCFSPLPRLSNACSFVPTIISEVDTYLLYLCLTVKYIWLLKATARYSKFL